MFSLSPTGPDLLWSSVLSEMVMMLAATFMRAAILVRIKNNYLNMSRAKKALPKKRAKVVIKDLENIIDDPTYSEWFVTINTNRVVRPTDTPYINEFRRKLAHIMENFTSLMSVNDPEHPFATMDDEALFPYPMEIYPALEIGKQRRLHAHLTVSVEHFSNVRINLEEINRVCAQMFNGCYVNVKFASGRKGGTSYQKKTFDKPGFIPFTDPGQDS